MAFHLALNVEKRDRIQGRVGIRASGREGWIGLMSCVTRVMVADGPEVMVEDKVEALVCPGRELLNPVGNKRYCCLL